MTTQSDEQTVAAYEPHLRAEAARRWLGDFCARMDPSYQSARHTRILCDHLQAVERGDIRRLMVFMPPRHSKSYHVSQRFPAWYLGRHPDHQVMLLSYGDDLAEDNSRKVRNLVQDGAYPFATRVAKDSSAVNRWGTEQGGVVVAAGIKGAVTGRGANILVVDDPIKDREDADSETMRNKVWDGYTDVALTRLMPGGRIVLCQTRWHDDDLAGRILNGPDASQWTVVEMPAIGDDGEPLWPEWFDAEYFQNLRNVIGSRSWSALYMQRPTAAEGGTFKHEWMKRLHTEKDLEQVKFRRVIQVCDSAFKTGVQNDPSAIHTWGTDGVDYYLLDMWKGRVEFPELLQALGREYRKPRSYMQPSRLYIEDTAAGQSAIQVLKRSSNIPVIASKVKESKEARAEQFSAPLFEAGKVSLPKNHPLLADYITEMTTFPTGRHDEHVDCTSMANKELRAGFGGNKSAFFKNLGIKIRPV